MAKKRGGAGHEGDEIKEDDGQKNEDQPLKGRRPADDRGIFGAGVFGVPELVDHFGMLPRKAKELVRDRIKAARLSKSEALFTDTEFRKAIEEMIEEQYTSDDVTENQTPSDDTAAA